MARVVGVLLGSVEKWASCVGVPVGVPFAEGGSITDCSSEMMFVIGEGGVEEELRRPWPWVGDHCSAMTG